MSSSRAKGQTALEVLFIAGIILIGAAIILPGYLDGNNDTVILMHVKNAADNACSYLNTGVVIEEAPYTPLNTLIKNVNYTPIPCRVRGVAIVTSTKDAISLKVSIVYFGSLGEDNLSKAIASFLAKELKSEGFSQSGETLAYGGKTVNVTIEVVRR